MSCQKFTLASEFDITNLKKLCTCEHCICCYVRYLNMMVSKNVSVSLAKQFLGLFAETNKKWRKITQILQQTGAHLRDFTHI